MSAEQYEITLREMLEQHLLYLRELESERWHAHVQEHRLVAEALSKQSEVQEVRNAAQNEWRASMTDLTNRFATREHLDAQMANAFQRISKLEADAIRIATISEEHRAQANRNQWLIGVLFTVISLAFAILSRFIR